MPEVTDVEQVFTWPVLPDTVPPILDPAGLPAAFAAAVTNMVWNENCGQSWIVLECCYARVNMICKLAEIAGVELALPEAPGE